jgi:hypothetical protein
LLVPLGSWLHEATGRWEPVLWALVAFDWATAFLVLFVLRSLRRRTYMAPDSKAAVEPGADKP